MTSRKKKRLFRAILIIIVSIFIINRLYNAQPKFHTTAEESSYYGIVEAKLPMRDKLLDFGYLYDNLEAIYPFFQVNKRANGTDWLKNKKKYKRIIKNTKNDVEFFAAIQNILGDLNDPHVKILDGEAYKRFYKYNNQNLGYFGDYCIPMVMYRYKFNGDIKNIKSFEGTSLETKVLIEDELAYMKINSMMDPEESVKDYREIKEFAKTVKNYEKLIIDIRGNEGGYDSYWEYIVKVLGNDTFSANYYSFFKDENRYAYDPFIVKDLKVVDVLDEDIVNKFPKEIKQDFDYYKTYSIGLDSDETQLNSVENVNFSGKIYLLVDKNVFSSSEKFAAFSKDSGFATLVGEHTGGGMIYEELPYFYLPQTNFVISYSREVSMNKDGTINMETKTIPHIQVDSIPDEDFNKDECIQAVIRDKLN